MAVFSFSVPNKRPNDAEKVKEIKAYCEKNCLNFSGIVTNLLNEWWEDECKRRSKVQDTK